MSFTSDIKMEISRTQRDEPCCALSELVGLLCSCALLEVSGEGGMTIKFTCENPAQTRHIKSLLRSGFSIASTLRVRESGFGRKSHVYELSLTDEADVMKVLAKSGMMPIAGADLEFSYKLDSSVLKKKCCRKACLKGMFLGSGIMSSPEKAYYLEMSFRNSGAASLCTKLLQSFDGLNCGHRQRRSRYVVYMKNGETIRDVLNIIGAHAHLLELENMRILKDVRAKATRESNCDEANIMRTLAAANRQSADIKLIEELIGLENLPDELNAAALTRKYHPAAAFAELGELMLPPVSKGCAYARMKRLARIADELRSQYELSIQ